MGRGDLKVMTKDHIVLQSYLHTWWYQEQEKTTSSNVPMVQVAKAPIKTRNGGRTVPAESEGLKILIMTIILRMQNWGCGHEVRKGDVKNVSKQGSLKRLKLLKVSLTYKR